MLSAGELERAGRGRYVLPKDACKIGKKEENGCQPSDSTAESGNLTNLTAVCENRAKVGGA
jgi:hypothetical protein